MDYNRVVKDLNGYNTEEFMQEIGKKFDIAPYTGEGPYHPEALHTFGLYLDGKWFKMTAKEEIITDDPVLGLDVSILQKELLEKCSALLTQASEALEKLKVLLPQVDSMDDVPAMAMAYHDQIVPAMAALRKPVDELELLVDKAAS